MLELKNLTKVYKTSRKEKTVAVNNVSLQFPSTGMIFVTGKSGSGKSTLLNMIGTLDNITSGEIIVDGVNFKEFGHKDFQEYRSSYLGFVFQDFLLLDEFTVYENISLALKLSGSEDEEYLQEIVKHVELEDKLDKFPNELSGGQRQRVAIARSLVKRPKMLLCDEPTGNLDFKTSKQILDILKEESKTKLVIIVSHNSEDAENYADRIIELADGSIIKDYTKNQEYSNNLIIEENYVVLPHHKDLSKKEVSLLNEKVKTSKFKLMQNKGGFYPTKDVDQTKGEFKLQSSTLGRKNSYKLSKMFFRKNKHGAPYTILITSLFISLFYIFQVFISFTPNNSVNKIRDENVVSAIKLSEQTLVGSLSTSSQYTIEDSIIEEFKNAGYEGNIYKLYNYGPSISANIIVLDTYTRITSLMDYTSIKETFGTLCCNEDYLKQLFSDCLDENGNLILTAGSLENIEKNIAITDYIADMMVNHVSLNYSSHEQIVSKSNKIKAVIYTGYKERYKDLFLEEEQAKSNNINNLDFLAQSAENPLFVDFLKEIQTRLAVNYSFADDFFEDIMSTYLPDQMTLSHLTFSDGNISSTYDKSITLKPSGSLKNNEVHMSYALYDALFGTMYSLRPDLPFEPVDVTIRKYYGNDPANGLEFEYTIHVNKLSDATTVSNEVYRELYKAKYHCYGLYFDNTDQYQLVKSVCDDQDLLISTCDTPVIPVINTILGIFKGLCYLIIVLLFIVSFAHIVMYGINSIKKNLYEIGVLKALGAKVFDIGKIFIIQISIIGFSISIVSILGIYLSSLFSDILLVSAFEEFLTITVYGLNIIPMMPKIVTFDLTLVFFISIISSIIPQLYLITIKPLNILKGKKK